MKQNSYIDSELKRIEQTSKLRYQSVENATKLAKIEQDKRLDSMNEFRQALKDNQTTFITRNEYATQHERLLEDIKSLRESRAESQGKASMSSVYISYLIAIIALILTLLRFFIK